uniref:Uncharacterized protein n=1 Tax=Physcomitrium patens TaxID=3218 RepID=A0A2K1JQA5_PHYPA|nr:hypothetical protein PHYPA_016101 [Physcomitrium patens]
MFTRLSECTKGMCMPRTNSDQYPLFMLRDAADITGALKRRLVSSRGCCDCSSIRVQPKFFNRNSNK